MTQARDAAKVQRPTWPPRLERWLEPGLPLASPLHCKHMCVTWSAACFGEQALHVWRRQALCLPRQPLLLHI